MTTIPASTIVNVNPNVLSAGGSGLDLSGLFLTNSARVPVGTVQSFPTAASVGIFFGGGSTEANLASIYFAGFDNSTIKPGALLFTQYNQAAVAAYMRGGNTSGLTLTALQALSGTLSLLIDGHTFTTASFSLSGATSFSNAASLIQAALVTAAPTLASFTGAISGTTLTVSAVASGVLAMGDTLVGAGITANTIITAFLTGTGSTGTYTVSRTQTVASESMTAAGTPPVVTFDSISNAFVITSGITGVPSSMTFATGSLSTSLLFTSATGAILSQGAAAAVPGTFMNAIVAQIQNWATFMTTFDPDGGSGNTVKLAFSAWTNTQNDGVAYVCWDTDLTPSLSNPAAGCLGQLLATANYSGTALIWSPDGSKAAFICGAAASIDFTATNGRITFNGKSQSGLTADVTSATVQANLLANNYNYYGAFGTANDSFVFYADGSVSGPFLWFDSYINQIWLSNAFQLDGVLLLTQALSIPFNDPGYTMVEAAFSDTINAGLNFGAFRAGVTLSSQQIAEVNAAAGKTISDTLSARGWYMQVVPASPQTRVARGPLQVNFWYMDGEAIQSINLTDILVQ